MKQMVLFLALLSMLFSCKKNDSFFSSAKDTAKTASADTILTKSAIETLNNTLIFDLYLNFEWTERNGNSAALLDFIPRGLSTPAKRIELQSKVGSSETNGTFTYNSDGLLDTARCEVDDSYYTYIVGYTNKVVNQIVIGGAPKIKMFYDSQGRLQTLTRMQSATTTLEFTFTYAVALKTVYIDLVVIENSTRKPSSSDYFAQWNDAFRLDAFYFNVYASSNIKYNASQNIASMIFSGSQGEITTTWNYTSSDSKNNWTARNWKDATFSRVISY